LCGFGNKSYTDKEMVVSNVFYGNLNDHNKALLEYNAGRDCYHGYVINLAMNEWVQKNG
ncbi:adenylate/guanylate cyclase domain-containing protein, partial [Vibrio anguillarum]|nr:adenylate/guanylate cyclase domain-containing protein [Vibrio anguillarum]